MIEAVSPETLAAIERNVGFVRERLIEPAGYGEAGWEDGLAYIDRFLNRQHEHGDPPNLSQTVGAYVGAAIVAIHGGRWVQGTDGIGVEVAPNLVAYPFAKVAKQLANGPADSVKSFVGVIGPMIRGEIDGGPARGER